MGFILSIPSVITLLSTVAVVLSGFLLYESIKGGGLPGCGAGSGCDEVTSSRWSRWMGMPTAGPGMLVYLLILAGSLLVRPDRSVVQQRMGWMILLGSSTVAAGAGIWFSGLQILVIKRLCPYCTILHMLGLGIAGLVLYAAPIGKIPADAWGISASSLMIVVIVAVGAIVILIAGQVLIVPKTYKVKELREAKPPVQKLPVTPIEPPAVEFAVAPTPAMALVSPPVKVAQSRRVVLAKGRVTVEVHDWPILGSPQAKHVLVDLFDYTCDDCRHVQHLLKQAVQRYGNQLAIVQVPVPLERACNPLVKQDEPRHANACQYARLALAVWLARPEKFEQFHHWVLEPELPPPVAAAKRRAEELAGTEALQRALPSPAIERQLHEGMGILKAVGGGKVPKLLLPQAVVWGRVPSVPDLCQVLHGQLTLGA